MWFHENLRSHCMSQSMDKHRLVLQEGEGQEMVMFDVVAKVACYCVNVLSS